ncbi:MAG: hypothetical protein F6K28_15985 [Microcoleus sp. SIO2G3]|nr:hypothetical protein [Microcoleus sp. SIO2G3]
MLSSKTHFPNSTPYTTPAIDRFASVSECDDAFLACFPYRFSFLWAEHPDGDDRPQWQTESRHPLSDRLINQGAFLYGVRFGSKTNYFMIDLDRGSQYHPYRDPYAIGRMIAALEPIGLVRPVIVSSSYSGGLHLYFPFPNAQPSWAIAQAAQVMLQSRGFKLASGQFELFPNPKLYSMEGATEYSGHRLPLQTGSYLLNEDFQPIYGDRNWFVRQWEAAADCNFVSAAAINRALKQFKRSRFARVKGKAQKFLADLNAEIEVGWTGHGQTNRLIGKIAQREYIFGHVLWGGEPLTGDALASQILETAQTLPGYEEWCRHQDDIVDICRDWAACVEKSRYYHFGSEEQLSEAAIAPQPSQWNQQQAEDARERIRLAVNTLNANDEMPDGLTERRNKIATISGCSVNTCNKNRDLWGQKSLKPAPRAQDHPVDEKTDDAESLKPAPRAQDHPVGDNKFYTSPADAPSARSAEGFTVSAVGGCGGQEETPHGPDMVLAVLQQIRAQKAKSAAIADGLPVPDEQYFKQTLQRCEHPRAHTGLDAHYCPDCRMSIDYGTAGYERILQRSIERRRFRPPRSVSVHEQT